MRACPKKEIAPVDPVCFLVFRLRVMIQDDPSNHRHAKLDYFPLKLDSEDEIHMNGISVTVSGKGVVGLKKDKNAVHFKYALLIGLCK